MARPGQGRTARVYFTCYYLGMGIVPALAGFARDASHNPAAPLYVAGSMLLLTLYRTAAISSNTGAQLRGEEAEDDNVGHIQSGAP